MGVAIGRIHKCLLATAALDELGRVLGVTEFPNDIRGSERNRRGKREILGEIRLPEKGLRGRRAGGSSAPYATSESW
jgi:hypothetical protein